MSVSEKEAHNRFLAGIEAGIEAERERTRRVVYEFRKWCLNERQLYSDRDSDFDQYEAKRYFFWFQGTEDLLEMLYGANYEEEEAYQG